MARTMLALRLALMAAEPPQPEREVAGTVATIVFDEVDAGIGGKAANAVGDALVDLAATHQVLVVTHLAQVGARASTHHVVSKHVAGGRTYTEVSAVSGDARVDEVARMLAGTVGTEARSHAAALLSS